MESGDFGRATNGYCTTNIVVTPDCRASHLQPGLGAWCWTNALEVGRKMIWFSELSYVFEFCRGRP